MSAALSSPDLRFTVSATTAWHIARVAEARGLRAAARKLPPHIEPRSDQRVALDRVLDGWAALVDALGEEAVPAVSEHARLHARSLLSFLCQAQPTIGAALETFVRFAHLAIDAWVWRLTRTVDAVWLETSLAHLPDHPGLAPLVLFDIVDIIDEARDVAGLSPLSIEFELPIDGAERWAPALGGPVRCGASRTRITWPAGIWDRALRTAHEGLSLELARRAESIAPRPSTWSERVAEVIPTLLPDASAERVARQLGVSTRTLERRLTAEGSSYRALRAEAFARLAERWLSTGTSSAEIAERLGYRNVAAFARARRGWQRRPRPSTAARTDP